MLKTFDYIGKKKIMKKKPLAEHTDRELLEKSVVFQKITAENSTTIKMIVVAYAILSVIGAIIVMANFS